jgi:hypothetical protein
LRSCFYLLAILDFKYLLGLSKVGLFKGFQHLLDKRFEPLSLTCLVVKSAAPGCPVAVKSVCLDCSVTNLACLGPESCYLPEFGSPLPPILPLFSCVRFFYLIYSGDSSFLVRALMLRPSLTHCKSTKIP